MSLPKFLNQRINSHFFSKQLKVLPFVQSITTQNQVFTLISDLKAAHNAWFTSPYSNADFSATQMLNSSEWSHNMSTTSILVGFFYPFVSQISTKDYQPIKHQIYFRLLLCLRLTQSLSVRMTKEIYEPSINRTTVE